LWSIPPGKLKKIVGPSSLKREDYAYSLGFRFHPGTIKYLKEQKVWKAKYE